jgi:hypothetical protein
MKTFKREIATILLQLRGCPWAGHPDVADVIAEYIHFEQSGKTPTQSRRVSLQIFHSFLRWVRAEHSKPTPTGAPFYIASRYRTCSVPVLHMSA